MKKALAIFLSVVLLVSAMSIGTYAVRGNSVMAFYGTPVSTAASIDPVWNDVPSCANMVQGWADNSGNLVKFMYDDTNLYLLLDVKTVITSGNFNMLYSTEQSASGQCPGIYYDFGTGAFSEDRIDTTGFTVYRVDKNGHTYMQWNMPLSVMAPGVETVDQNFTAYFEVFGLLNGDNWSWSMTADELWSSYSHCSTGTGYYGTLLFSNRTGTVSAVSGTPHSENNAIDGAWDDVEVAAYDMNWEAKTAAAFRFMYDETNLYVLNTLSADTTNGHLELLISADPSYGGTAPTMFHFYNADTVYQNGDFIKDNVSLVREGAVIEYTIPWATIAPGKTVSTELSVYLGIINFVGDNRYSWAITDKEANDYTYTTTGTACLNLLTLALPTEENLFSSVTAEGGYYTNGNGYAFKNINIHHGAMAFTVSLDTAFLTSVGSMIESAGLNVYYVGNTDNSEKWASVSADGASLNDCDGTFRMIVDPVDTDDFDKEVVALPFVVMTDGTVISGTASNCLTKCVNDFAASWLGEIAA